MLVERARGEIAAVLASAALHFGCTLGLSVRGLDLVLIGGGWLVYAVARVRADRGQLRRWGLTLDDLGPTVWAGFWLLVVGGGTLALWAFVQRSLVLDWRLVALLVLYPAWGLVQQFLVLSILVQDLGLATRLRSARSLVPLGGIAFGLVHLPDLALAAATTVLGAAFVLVFLRWRCLWPLALVHGWLGALFYRWVLQRDPWQELFG